MQTFSCEAAAMASFLLHHRFHGPSLCPSHSAPGFPLHARLLPALESSPGVHAIAIRCSRRHGRGGPGLPRRIHGHRVHNSETDCSETHQDRHCHQHEHGHGHHHYHPPPPPSDHGHCYGHNHASWQDLNALQRAILRAASATGLGKLADLLRDNLCACCASMALLLLAAVGPHARALRIGSTVQTWLILIAFPLVGVPAILDAVVDISGLKVNIHLLMALAAFASVIMGNTLEGALLLSMFNLSHIAEDYLVKRAMGDIKALKDSNPEFALVLEAYDASSPALLSAIRYTQVPIQKVEMGSHILIRAGEAVPVDGEVLQGRSMITVEHLTGEVEPIEKQRGDTVPGGARNLDGMMILKVTKTWQDSTIARIMKLTGEALLNKPKLQRWLDEFGQIYSQAVVVASIVVALFGPLLFKWPFLSNSGARGSVYRALGLMVAVSPCALAVAPLVYATAVSSCASKGILIKGGQALDSIADCDTIAFDKTGTLTTGDLICKAIEPIHGHDSDELNRFEIRPCCSPSCEVEALAVAAALERGATHPIARAVVDHSEGRKLPDIAVENFESLPGMGLAATVYGLELDKDERHEAHMGSLEYVASLSACSYDYDKIKEAAMASSHGNELVRAALSVNKKVTLFHFEDKLRAGVADAITSLKESGLNILMLTGDHFLSANRVAKAVGIDEVYFGLKPEDKLDRVKSLSQNTGKGSYGGLIMVGDGVNDAPALAAATIGIVLAKHASAAAIAVADVLLLQDNINGIPFVVAKARQTTTLVKQSVALALSCILLAALPSVLGALPLWLTVLLHEGGTLLVCLNSVRAFNNPVKSWSWSKNMRSWISHPLISNLCSRTHRRTEHVQPATSS